MYVCNTRTVMSVKIILPQNYGGPHRPLWVFHVVLLLASSHDGGFTHEPFQHGHKPGFTNHSTGFISACSSTVGQHMFFGHCALVGLTLTTHDTMHHCRRATLPFFFLLLIRYASLLRTKKASIENDRILALRPVLT